MHHIRLLLSVLVLPSVALVGCSSQPVGPSALPSTTAGSSAVTSSVAGGRPASPGIIYVTSQGLYFDTFVTVDPLPMKGPFQPLADTDGDGISETPYGPGDPGYLAGRWWVDVNENGEKDAGDHFFLCPLLGPGRPTP